MLQHLKQTIFSFSPKERITFIAAIALTLISGGALLVFWIQRSTEIVPAFGGELTEGVTGQPAHLNPIVAVSEIDKSLVRLTFAPLAELAEKTEVSEDGRTWKVRLKEKLFWSNGEKLTSDDVIFTVERIQDPEIRSPYFSMWQGVSATRLSELELQFVLANPYAFFSYNLEGLFPVPKHVLDDVAPANWQLGEFNLKPVGNGPYFVETYKARPDGFIEMYRLRSNPRYAKGRAFIDAINIKFFLSAENLVKEFNAGQIDAVAGLATEQLREVRRPRKAVSFRLPRYYAVFLNQSKNLALKEQNVRRALSLAVNREDLVLKILDERGVPTYGPIPPGAKYALADIRGNRFSPDTAKEALDEAGWKVGETGGREKTIKNSTIPLQMNIVVPQITFLIETANALKSAWEGVGFRVNVVPRPPNEVADAIIKNRDYEALLFGNVLSASSDLFSFWHSSERFHPGLNLSMYSSKNVDALITASRQNLNSEERAKQFGELQADIATDYPAIFLYSPDYPYLTTKNLNGPEDSLVAEPSDRFQNAAAWYLRTARSFKRLP